jgi:hypothetical protein
MLRRQDSNLRPVGYEPTELPTALRRGVKNYMLSLSTHVPTGTFLQSQSWYITFSISFLFSYLTSHILPNCLAHITRICAFIFFLSCFCAALPFVICFAGGQDLQLVRVSNQMINATRNNITIKFFIFTFSFSLLKGARRGNGRPAANYRDPSN